MPGSSHRARTAFERHEQRHEDTARLTAALDAMFVEATFRRMPLAAIVVAMRRTWNAVPQPAGVTPEQWASAYYSSLGRCLTSHFLRAGISGVVSDDSQAMPLRGVTSRAADPVGAMSSAVPLFIDEASRPLEASSRVGFGAARLYAALLQSLGREVRISRVPSEVEEWR
jgi:dihydrofolate reductase